MSEAMSRVLKSAIAAGPLGTPPVQLPALLKSPDAGVFHVLPNEVVWMKAAASSAAQESFNEPCRKRRI
jgi:hypothetical protein